MTAAVNPRLYNGSTSANARNRETCRPIGDQRGYCGVCPPIAIQKNWRWHRCHTCEVRVGQATAESSPAP